MRLSCALIAMAMKLPFRRLVKSLVQTLPFSSRVKSVWDAVGYPQYLLGVTTRFVSARAR